MDPLGIQKACTTKVRMIIARAKAQTIVSRVSLHHGFTTSVAKTKSPHSHSTGTLLRRMITRMAAISNHNTAYGKTDVSLKAKKPIAEKKLKTRLLYILLHFCFAFVFCSPD
jgi:hypothetical protein